MKRRTFLVSLAASVAGSAPAEDFAGAWRADGASTAPTGKTSGWGGAQGASVYFTREISSNALLKIYAALGIKLPGSVGVKVSTGEPGGHHFINPQMAKALVASLDANIVECNTAYGGRRGTLSEHIRAALEHGWADIAAVDIMDGLHTLNLPVPEGSIRLKHDIVGSHFRNYDSFLVLSHFKGHAMGGFGGALKNLSIGFASRNGKMLIHTGGKTDLTWRGGKQLEFLEAMAEAAGAVHQARPNAMAYINVANNLSVSCDCDSHPAPPTMNDIGIFASLDPVAVDQACVDAIYAAPDGKDLIARMESRQGIHILEHAAALNLGSRAYRLIEI